MQKPSPRLIKLTAQPTGAPAHDHPKPHRLVQGNPLRETWNLVQADLPAGELFTVISGRCRVHDSLGGFEAMGPGEGLYIPPGFEGEFEVLEPLTKTYMICE